MVSEYERYKILMERLNTVCEMLNDNNFRVYGLDEMAKERDALTIRTDRLRTKLLKEAVNGERY